MRVDERATAEARRRQEYGIRILNAIFAYDPIRAPLNIQTGRALPDRKARRIWRGWRDSTFAGRAERRRRRKTARESRRRNQAWARARRSR